MIEIFSCRRSSLAVIGMIILGAALFNGVDTSGAIAMICMSVAGSNAAEKALIQKYKGEK